MADGSDLEVIGTGGHANHGCGGFKQNWLSVPSYDHFAATSVNCVTDQVLIFEYDMKEDQTKWLALDKVSDSSLVAKPYAVSLTTAAPPEIMWIGTLERNDIP